MKKTLSIIVGLCLMFLFAGCSTASDTSQQCLSVNRDDFLSDLKNGLQERWDMVKTDIDTDKTFEEEVSFDAKLVDAEYKHLKKYFGCTFDDLDFQTVATEYLTALKGQYDITRKKNYSDVTFDTKWSEYYSERLILIKTFYNQYGLNIDPKYYPTLYKINIDAAKKEISSDTLSSLRGEWECASYKWNCIIFDGLTVSFVRWYDSAKTRVSETTTTFLSLDNETNLVLLDDHLRTNYVIEFVDTDNIKIKDLHKNDYDEYKKISDNTHFPEPMKDPYIGMSKSELENSTWGTPYKKNKTTSSNGIKEQWVYNKSFNRKAYVYITNGCVTAIQER